MSVHRLGKGIIELVKLFTEFKWNIDEFVDISSNTLNGEKVIIIKRAEGIEHYED